MLGHQLPEFPSLAPCLGELPRLFAGLEGGVEEAVASTIAYRRDEDESWSPPPSVFTCGMGVPLKTVRSAAESHLLVELANDGRTRLIEPSSLRRTSAGNLILHAERADGSGHRSYPVERIEGLRTTTTFFRPRSHIEFSTRRPLRAPPQYRTLVPPASRTSRSRSSARSTREFLYECPRCGRQFADAQRNAALRGHNDPCGSRCSGRRGRYVGKRY